MGMAAAVLLIELRIPHASSLKDKRAVVRPLLDGARRRFAVAAAEVGAQELHQRAELGFAAIGAPVSQVESILDAVERFVWSHTELEVVAASRHFLDTDP